MMNDLIEKIYIKPFILIFVIAIFTSCNVNSVALPDTDEIIIVSPQAGAQFHAREEIFINVTINTSSLSLYVKARIVNPYQEATLGPDGPLNPNNYSWSGNLSWANKTGAKTVYIIVSNESGWSPSVNVSVNIIITPAPANLSVSMNASLEYNDKLYISAHFLYNNSKWLPGEELRVIYFKSDDSGTLPPYQSRTTDEYGNATWMIICDTFKPGNWTFNISYSQSSDSDKIDYEEIYILQNVTITPANATIYAGYIRLTDNETLFFAYAKDKQGPLKEAPSGGTMPVLHFWKERSLGSLTLSEGFAYSVIGDSSWTTEQIQVKIDHDCYSKDYVILEYTQNIYSQDIGSIPIAQSLYQGNYLNVSFPVYYTQEIASLSMTLYSATSYISISLTNTTYRSDEDWHIYESTHFIDVNYREGDYLIEFDFNDSEGNYHKFTDLKDEQTSWQFKIQVLKVDLVCELNETLKEKSGDYYYYVFYIKAYYTNSSRIFEGTITLKIRDKLISADYDSSTGLWVADYVTKSEIDEISISAFDSYDHSAALTKSYDVAGRFQYEYLIPVFVGLFLGLIMMVQFKRSKRHDTMPEEDVEITEKFDEKDTDEDIDEKEVYSKLQDDLFT